MLHLLTYQIVPHINGVNSIRIISILADADFFLTCRAIRHLLYYGCLFLLDIFSFSAIYAPTAQFSSTIASDEAMQQECARYVNTTFAPSTIPNTAPLLSPSRPDLSPMHTNPPRFDPHDIWPPISDPSPEDTENPAVVDGIGIVELYASLKQGQSLKQWYLQHSRELAYIDIRRFITFGIIKGFLYRVQKYAYATGLPAPVLKSTPTHTPLPGSTATTPHTRSSSRARTTVTPNTPSTASSVGDEAPISTSRSRSVDSGSDEEGEEEVVDDKTLAKYLDGLHCFDQICTELEISEKELTERLKRYPGEVLILHR